MQEELAKPKLTLQDRHETVPFPSVLQVAHPEGQAEQFIALPPGEVVPEAQAVQEALAVSSKLGLQVWQVVVPLVVLQVAHPLAQAEQVAVPPAEVCPAGQAVQAVPFVSWKLALHDWQVTVPLVLVLQVAHPVVQAEQVLADPPGEVVPAAQAVQEALAES